MFTEPKPYIKDGGKFKCVQDRIIPNFNLLSILYKKVAYL